MVTKHVEEDRNQKPFPPRKRNNDPTSEKEQRSISDRTIKVSNIPSVVNKETLEMIFESKRNGGGETDGIVYDQRKGIALITYKEPEVAKTIIQKEVLIYKSYRFAITKPIEKQDQASSVSSRMVDVSDNPPGMTKETLRRLLENKSGGDVESIGYDQNHNTTVVTFTDSVAADVLISVGWVLYKGKHLFITRHVEKANERKDTPKERTEQPSSSNRTIFVSQIPRKLNKEYLVMIFVIKRNGGGIIEDVVYDEEKGTAVITFEDSNVAASFIKKGMAEFKGQRMLITKHENQVADAGRDEDSDDNN